MIKQMEVTEWLKKRVRMLADEANSLSDNLSSASYVNFMTEFDICLDRVSSIHDKFRFDVSQKKDKVCNKKEFDQLTLDEVKSLIDHEFPDKSYYSLLDSKVSNVRDALFYARNKNDLMEFGISSTIDATDMFNRVYTWKSEGVPITKLLDRPLLSHAAESHPYQVNYHCNGCPILNTLTIISPSNNNVLFIQNQKQSRKRSYSSTESSGSGSESESESSFVSALQFDGDFEAEWEAELESVSESKVHDIDDVGVVYANKLCPSNAEAPSTTTTSSSFSNSTSGSKKSSKRLRRSANGVEPQRHKKSSDDKIRHLVSMLAASDRNNKKAALTGLYELTKSRKPLNVLFGVIVMRKYSPFLTTYFYLVLLPGSPMVDRFIRLGAVDAMVEVLFQKDSDDEVGHAIYHNYIMHILL